MAAYVDDIVNTAADPVEAIVITIRSVSGELDNLSTESPKVHKVMLT